MDSEVNIQDIESAFKQALPLMSDQKAIFSQLIDSIAYCEKLGSSAWSLSLLQKRQKGFRLNVGPVEAMTCFFYAGGFEEEKPVCQLRWLLADSSCLDRVPSSCEYAEINEMQYASVGTQHWCYRGSFQIGLNGTPDPRRLAIEGHLALLRDNHRQFLQAACHTSTGKVRQGSLHARFHCKELFDYANRVAKGAG